MYGYVCDSLGCNAVRHAAATRRLQCHRGQIIKALHQLLMLLRCALPRRRPGSARRRRSSGAGARGACARASASACSPAPRGSRCRHISFLAHPPDSINVISRCKQRRMSLVTHDKQSRPIEDLQASTKHVKSCTLSCGFLTSSSACVPSAHTVLLIAEGSLVM